MPQIGIAATIAALLLVLATPMLRSLWEDFYKDLELRTSSKLLIIGVIGAATVLVAQNVLLIGASISLVVWFVAVIAMATTAFNRFANQIVIALAGFSVFAYAIEAVILEYRDYSTTVYVITSFETPHTNPAEETVDAIELSRNSRSVLHTAFSKHDGVAVYPPEFDEKTFEVFKFATSHGEFRDWLANADVQPRLIILSRFEIAEENLLKLTTTAMTDEEVMLTHRDVCGEINNQILLLSHAIAGLLIDLRQQELKTERLRVLPAAIDDVWTGLGGDLKRKLRLVLGSAAEDDQTYQRLLAAPISMETLAEAVEPYSQNCRDISERKSEEIQNRRTASINVSQTWNAKL